MPITKYKPSLFAVLLELLTYYLHFSDIEVRLEGNLYNHAGRVEVRMNGGAWGTVCDDSFDHDAASVVCNMLGLGYVLHLQ